MPASCRPDGTVVIEFGDDGQRFDFHGLNPEVAKEIGATVVSGLSDTLFSTDPEMQQALRARHEQIGARVSALAPKTSVTIKHCQYLGGVSGTKTVPGSRGLLEFSPAAIKFMMWRVEGFVFDNAQRSSVAVYGAQEMQRLTATRMIGLGLFSLAAPKRRVNSYIVVTLTNGETAVFEVKNASAMGLQTRLSPWLAGH
jgi:hypothetical protein